MDESKPKNDDWKIHLFWICILAAILFLDRRDKNVVLKQMEEIQNWAKVVSSGAKELNDMTDRFDSENWRDVVPDVGQEAKGLYATVERLCIEIDKLEEELKPPPPDEGEHDPR